MKLTSIIVVIIIIFLLVWFFKVDNKDNAARKDAIKVNAIIEKVRCKQRLKGDKSLVIVRFQQKTYSIFFENEADCNKYSEKQNVTAYYSKNYDKLFLEL